MKTPIFLSYTTASLRSLTLYFRDFHIVYILETIFKTSLYIPKSTFDLPVYTRIYWLVEFRYLRVSLVSSFNFVCLFADHQSNDRDMQILHHLPLQRDHLDSRSHFSSHQAKQLHQTKSHISRDLLHGTRTTLSTESDTFWIFGEFCFWQI